MRIGRIRSLTIVMRVNIATELWTLPFLLQRTKRRQRRGINLICRWITPTTRSPIRFIWPLFDYAVGEHRTL